MKKKQVAYKTANVKVHKTPAQTAKILSDEDKDMICAKIKKNVELRLNVDYRKTFTSKWKSDLMNTYIDPNKQKSVNAYIKAAKARKVVLSSGEVIVDPSSLWIDDAWNMLRSCICKIPCRKTERFHPLKVNYKMK